MTATDPLVPPRSPAVPDLLAFAREFVRSPWTTASPLPTSRAACEVALGPLPTRGDPVVLELGAGAGATSSVVARRLDGRGRHIAVEVNPRLASALARRHPDVEVMCDEAVSAMADLAARGTAVDLVFSTLPISLAEDRSFLVAAGALLTPAGALSQVQHSWTRALPWAKAAERALGDAFEEVVISRTIWRNVPPATVTIARRPRGRATRADR